MSSLFVGVVAHKEFPMEQIPGYVPVFVGKKSDVLKKNFAGDLSYSDNEGENISFKNPFYSELTAQYWIYKNIKWPDFKGLVHYRRFFAGKNHNLITENEIKDILGQYDLILPTKVFSRRSIYETYKIQHNSNDLDSVREVISNKYPDYLPYFDRIMKRHGYHSLNMLITKNELFDKYSEWLFDVLFSVESVIEVPDDDYQRRVYGFLSERLLDVWVEANHFSTCELNIIYTDQSLMNKYYERMKKKVYQLLFKQ